MRNRTLAPFVFLTAVILTVSLACNLPSNAQPTPESLPTQTEPSPTLEPVTVPPTKELELPTAPVPTNTPTITFIDSPPSEVEIGEIVYDVTSAGTASQGRAPYGDSYDSYRLERPFTQDMTYIIDMDIASYNVSLTEKWIYVSIELVGSDPNNEIGIHYGVELDTNGDGFGEYLIWSNPPYFPEWSTDGVQVFADKNRDTGGLSAEFSDAPVNGDGYETLVFDSGYGDDLNLAWIRVNGGRYATIQFAFKQTLAGSSFLLGVLSDAGLKDVTRMFYNDRFTEEEAGSPEKSEELYPLKELYAFDNTCRKAIKYSSTGDEPLLCPRE